MNKNKPVLGFDTMFPLHKLAYNNAFKVFCGELHKLRIYRQLSKKEKKDAWREFRYAILKEDLKELNTLAFFKCG